MARRSSILGWVAGVGAILSAGCSSLPDWSMFGSLQQDAPALAAVGTYDFSWRLSGDHRAGPLQVFDDGRHTWLQFMADQPIPAIFVRTGQGDRLLSYQRQEPYVRLDGVWPVLVLRAGSLESRIERIAPASSLHMPTATEVPALKLDSDALKESAEPAPIAMDASSLDTTPEEDALVPTVLPVRVQPSYLVSPQDGNIRLALSRWATLSGWTFEAEHWAVDVDIPIVGSAAFDLEFDEAVQQLLASTELSDRPLQPCFYANKVLRVVPYAQSCDRTASLERV